MKKMNRIIRYLKKRYALRKGGDIFIDYLRSQGITIGQGCKAPHPSSLNIDTSRPYLVEIGNNVRLNKDLTIMTHDYATIVFKAVYHDFVPSSGKVKIGNNVYFGRQCTVLKGVSIGDNCIIGFGSIVMKDIPANSVAVGRPAKVICSLDEYYKKRKMASLQEAFKLAKAIQEKLGRRPIPSDFREEFVFFVSGDEIEKYPDIPIKFQLEDSFDCYDEWMKNHKAMFNSFEDFLKAAGL